MPDLYATDTERFHTVLDFLRLGFSRACEQELYYGHGTDNAWDDMLALILGSLFLPLDLNPLLLQGALTEAEKTKLCHQLARRIEERVPVPYLINKAHFSGLDFYVDERVLIPRSPIAELIEQKFSPWVDEHQVSRLLEIGTGSGCIAIACCYAFPDALVDAVDISPEALEVAEINRVRHGVQNELTLIKSDCFDAVPEGRYDIIVSNPPYVGQEEMITLPDEYRHEPKQALEAENNGLGIVERILHQASDHLTEQGILVVEVGNSEDALLAAYPNVPFTWLEFERGGQGVFLLTYDQLKQYVSTGQKSI